MDIFGIDAFPPLVQNVVSGKPHAALDCGVVDKGYENPSFSALIPSAFGDWSSAVVSSRRIISSSKV